jgi:hypothetical protein
LWSRRGGRKGKGKVLGWPCSLPLSLPPPPVPPFIPVNPLGLEKEREKKIGCMYEEKKRAVLLSKKINGGTE